MNYPGINFLNRPCHFYPIMVFNILLKMKGDKYVRYFIMALYGKRGTVDQP